MRRSGVRLAGTLAGVLAVCGIADPATPQAPPTFAVGVRVVNLDVQVSRGGRTVAGLTAADFVVKDNGVKQRVELVSQEETAVDAVLALDASSSVSGTRVRELQRAAHAFVNALWPTDSVSLFRFAGDLRVGSRPGASRVAVHAAIDGIEGRGSTSLRDALYAALLQSDPRRGRPLVLVFSDGRDRGSWLTEDAVRAVARASDVVVSAVLVGDEAQPFLRDLTRETGGRTWALKQDVELEPVFLAALEDFKSRYRLRYEPEGVRPGGWHALHVSLGGRKGDVLARRGYQGEDER